MVHVIENYVATRTRRRSFGPFLTGRFPRYHQPFLHRGWYDRLMWPLGAPFGVELQRRLAGRALQRHRRWFCAAQADILADLHRPLMLKEELVVVGHKGVKVH